MATLKLSEAIRLGSMLHPQVTGAMMKEIYRGEHAGQMGTCALGAAREAGYPVTEGRSGWSINGRIPLLELRCVVEDCEEDLSFGRRHEPTVEFMCSHLNDDHNWTRERIADWVETVEPKEQAATAPVEKTNEVLIGHGV